MMDALVVILQWFGGLWSRGLSAVRPNQGPWILPGRLPLKARCRQIPGPGWMTFGPLLDRIGGTLGWAPAVVYLKPRYRRVLVPVRMISLLPEEPWLSSVCASPVELRARGG